eukprot:GFUD01035018.1.p1 GENE.GFUD01035018.1~~GFUD01035018.1.p1  ORF type:complete len:327 (-),score=124.50 GFUD01035018.1:158-1138(-)
MSERKVLNKYYPPDFDPSKIPKSKEKRNATFAIRLMAPCNMRCTTCGEYIYKGRKFNARKEDVDDMNYLGLRIYRFYIKCTACVSEICFRTDPETTDYVLEAGATRNFEALKKAEDQADREAEARREELENNPMKLLEERTFASKNEMEVAESLEELRELNRRTVAVDYPTMLAQYQKVKRTEDEEEERKDEEFVKAVFSREEGGAKVKRIRDESSSDEEELASKVSRPTVTNPTDFLVDKKPVVEKKAVWEKSIGTLSSKGGLGVLVKKKVAVTNNSTAPNNTSIPTHPSAPVPSTVSTPSTTPSTSNALGMLGAYSGSSDSASE